MLIIYRTDARQIAICGGYFLAGALIHKFGLLRYASVGSVLLVGIAWLCLSRWLDGFVMASNIALPFFALAFGSAQTPLLSSMSKWDYSYGIYIYAFPVQQAMAYFFPDITLPAYLATTSLMVIVLAGLSWHVVEKPALKLKPKSARRVACEREAAVLAKS